MRQAVMALVALTIATACKDGGVTAPAADGTLNVEIETRTCASAGSLDVEVFVDHVLVGTPTLMVGTVASYTVTAGSHTVGGIEASGKFDWGFITVEVPAGGQYTAEFACQ
jgi:hypothetical protein